MPLFVGASESYDTDAWEAYNLKKENAKLRELVRGLVYATHPADRARLIADATELVGERKETDA